MTIAADLAPTGTLRASINLGNPVLAQGTPDEPAGVTVDLAREVAARLGVPVEFRCFDAARKSFEAMTGGLADLCFLAIDPARESEVAFTAPYVVIEGVYVVPDGSPIRTAAEVDSDGVRVGVKRGSAYDLFLTRELAHATVVRGDEGVQVFAEEKLEAGAGIRQPVTEFAAAHPGHRVVEDAFMQIRQALGTTRTRRPETVRFLRDLVEELKASGFVAESLRRSNRLDATVAPPALEVRPARGDRLEDWRAIHNAIIPTAPLSAAEVAERAGRHRLTLAYRDGELVGNATVRPPADETGTATVIVRVLPQHRRQGIGADYLRSELAEARAMGARRIETVILESNADGLAFAAAHGFVEHDRYTLPGQSTAFVDLHLAPVTP